MATRHDVGGGDQRYLREQQYGATTNLDARTRLHLRARTAEVPWFTWLPRLIRWPTDATVVEVGCGSGSMWAEAADPWPPGRYLLTDQSIGMVDAATERSATRLSTGFGTVSDAQALPWREASADVVVANHMLYHVPDIPRAVAELARVLRPDGVALVSTNGADHMRELAEILRTAFPASEALSLEVARFGRENGGDVLGASFVDVAWHPYPETMVSHDPDDVVGYLTSFPPAEAATDDERAALRAAIDDAFDRGGGTLRITKDTGAFVCRRPRHR